MNKITDHLQRKINKTDPVELMKEAIDLEMRSLYAKQAGDINGWDIKDIEKVEKLVQLKHDIAAEERKVAKEGKFDNKTIDELKQMILDEGKNASTDNGS